MGRNGEGAGFGEGGAGGVIDFGVRVTLADAGEDGGVGGGRAVVIAEKRGEGVGGAAVDGAGLVAGLQRASVAIVLE